MIETVSNPWRTVPLKDFQPSNPNRYERTEVQEHIHLYLREHNIHPENQPAGEPE